MKIEFELKDNQNILIWGISEDGKARRNIGRIFTPSSSGGNIKNAIQICGFSEAFDFWGCARYMQPTHLDTREKIIDSLENKKEEFKQTKDIQLMFDIETSKTSVLRHGWDDCLACFNKPCTCENKGNHKHISPYNVKREEDLKGKLEYLKDGKIHLKFDERQKLLKKLKDKK